MNKVCIIYLTALKALPPSSDFHLAVIASFLSTEGFSDPFLPGHYQTLLTADCSLATGPELSMGFIHLSLHMVKLYLH